VFLSAGAQRCLRLTSDGKLCTSFFLQVHSVACALPAMAKLCTSQTKPAIFLTFLQLYIYIYIYLLRFCSCALSNRIHPLQGHTGVISAIAWSFDSIYLASTDRDGVMISWFMDEYSGYSKHVNQQGSIYTSLLYEPSRQFIYACGPNVPLCIFDTDKISTSRQVLPELFSNPDYQLDPSKMYTRLDNQERVGTSLAHLIFRSLTQVSIHPSIRFQCLEL
jgi:hypothetical protein